MEANLWILTAGVLVVLGSLLFTFLNFRHARKAEKLTFKVGDQFVELDSNKLFDAEKILEIAGRQSGTVEVSIDGLPVATLDLEELERLRHPRTSGGPLDPLAVEERQRQRRESEGGAQ